MHRYVVAFIALALTISKAGAQPKNPEAWAAATPKSAEKSISTLAAYLGQAGPTQLAKARAIYSWVGHHIVYDAAMAAGGAAMVMQDAKAAETNPRFTSQQPTNVLAARKAVCQGYAALVQALADEFGIPCLTVSGWDRGRMGGRLTSPSMSHTWNIIRADGRWLPIDATWGAGHMDGNGQFVAAYDTSQFDAVPAVFARQHMPADPAAQLLPSPLPRQAFTAEPPAIDLHLQKPAVAVRYAFADSLNAGLALAAPERDAAAYRRALQADGTNAWARLKLADYNASLALGYMDEYLASLPAINKAGKLPAPMRDKLVAARSHLKASRTILATNPGADANLAAMAKNHLAMIDHNLASIDKQLQFWGGM